MSPLPKAELHAHIEGTVAPATAREIAARNGVALPENMFDGPHYRWSGFTGFLDAYSRTAAVLKSAQDYTDITYAYLSARAAAGSVYEELILSRSHGLEIGLSWPQMVQAVARGCEKAKAQTGIECRLHAALVRHCPSQSWVAAAQACLDFPHPLVTGFNIAGDENLHHFRDFVPAMKIVRKAGLKISAHAGEAAGPQSVWDALEYIKPERIGHGVRCIEDPALVQELVRRGITLEICPSSNIAIGVYPSYETHPLRKLWDAGVKITLGSDDPPFFHTTLEHEYDIAAKKFGFSEAELLQVTRNAIEAAFVDEETRQILLNRLENTPDSL